MKVLLLEDDAELRDDLARWLRRECFAIDEADTLCRAAELLCCTEYDCLVLDRMLPDGDSLDALVDLRATGDMTPALFLSCRRTRTEDLVAGLRGGGDDYVIKPVARAEFLARVDALCRRSVQPWAPVHDVGPLVVDTARRRVTRDGAEIALTAREFSVLALMASRQGEVVEKSELVERCWGERESPMSNTVDVHIARLRKKLGLPSMIETRRGVGYSLVSPT